MAAACGAGESAVRPDPGGDRGLRDAPYVATAVRVAGVTRPAGGAGRRDDPPAQPDAAPAGRHSALYTHSRHPTGVAAPDPAARRHRAAARQRTPRTGGPGALAATRTPPRLARAHGGGRGCA